MHLFCVRLAIETIEMSKGCMRLCDARYDFGCDCVNTTNIRRELTPAGPTLTGQLLAWMGFISGTYEEEEPVLVAEFDEHEDVSYQNRECAMPKNTADWNYYDGLVNKNRHTVKVARSVKKYAPKYELVEDQEEDGDDSIDELGVSQIPHRLLFTHKDNLLDCSVSSSEDSAPSLHTMAENVHDTIKIYQNLWPDVEVAFLTDADCRKTLSVVEPELLKYYDELDGMFKGDLCRAADLCE